jgi:hypothetical protein
VTNIEAGQRAEGRPVQPLGLPATAFSARIGPLAVAPIPSRLHPPIMLRERGQPRNAVRLRPGTRRGQSTNINRVFLAGRVWQRGRLGVIDPRLVFRIDSLRPGE